jgi:hypothetical protein
MEHLKELPYEVHTNNELEFMLERNKPLSCFYIEYPNEYSVELREAIIPEREFFPYVSKGEIVKKEYLDVNSGIRYVFYALPKETWRIEKYINLLTESNLIGWSEALERLQGNLLGYEEWQNDAWIKHLKNSPFGKRLKWLNGTENL